MGDIRFTVQNPTCVVLIGCSPVYGVIFLFKYPTGEEPSGTPNDGNFDFEAAENLFFAAQTIQNACGTQALLSVLLNKEAEVDIGSQLKEFKEFTGAFPSEVRRCNTCNQPTALADPYDDSYEEKLCQIPN